MDSNVSGSTVFHENGDAAARAVSSGGRATSEAGLSTSGFASPVGTLTLVSTDEALVAILWDNDDPARVRLGTLSPSGDPPILARTASQLREYFAGTRRVFTVPLAFTGTDFQRRVWAALLAIPFGETRSYGEIARAIGRPSAARAVGAANGRNPISIIAPCHRVIGATGRLTGFAGGVAVKARLLDLERRAVVGQEGAGQARAAQAMPRPMPV